MCQTVNRTASVLGAEEGLCAACSSGSSGSSVTPLRLPEQQTLAHGRGGIPPPSSHDPELLLIFISELEKKEV